MPVTPAKRKWPESRNGLLVLVLVTPWPGPGKMVPLGPGAVLILFGRSRPCVPNSLSPSYCSLSFKGG